jgi:nucleoside-diphosphate-sugar epimerase
MVYQRIAIIGCGYVGSAVGEALVQAGHHVVGTTITPDRLDDLRAKGIAPAVLDTADTDRVHEVLHDRDAVVLSVAAGRKRGDYRKVYLGSANSVITAAKNTPVNRIIYTSSIGVYGQDDGSWVDESSPVQPPTENGRILLDTERTLLDGANALGGEQTVSVSVVRLSGIYGPDRDLSTRIKSFAGKERDDGDAYLNLIHLDDIVAALTALLSICHHGVLNLSDDRPLTRREFYDRIIAEAGLPPIQWVPTGSPRQRGKRVRNDLIKRTLGLTFQHPTH